MPKALFKADWNSKSLEKVDFFIWILLNRGLNTEEKLQRKLLFITLQSSICILCLKKANEDQNYILFLYSYVELFCLMTS